MNRVEEVVRQKGESMAADATAYALHKGVCPILGMNSKKRVEEACDSLQIKLSEEKIKYLEEQYLPKPITGY